VPVYVYKCKDCLETFEVKHSMFDGQNACILCGGENIYKVPAILDIKTSNFNSSKTGQVVDDYIKRTKQEMKSEKQKLKNKEL